ncbi:hypothetical protein BFS06_11385 [Clostridium perfringens]|uniref:3'-phosphate/5'-hydroxy nucleic acid ligase n=1 Tax=Clostridium perfringens TaxID=1502 RepID=A0A140GRY6_CLOPF|nr:RtcB family protein [Clostridium perfringens]AMN31295.1 tRNA-splicing ligase RtcB [Clostridium perfringens]TBX14817.1 hypothetical protein BFS06_11385 [Clostridium perfringens]
MSFELNGRFNTAKIFTDFIEDGAISQILNVLNNENFKDSIIKIMPDCHVGKECVIGFTMTIDDSVCVNLVSGDIGCGVLAYKLKEREIDFEKLENVIRSNIAMGAEDGFIKNKLINKLPINSLYCGKNIKLETSLRTFFSLGGGNHYIEIDKSEKDGSLYLVVHTGSRKFGGEIAKFYNEATINQYMNENFNAEQKIDEVKKSLIPAGRQREIPKLIEKIRKEEANFRANIKEKFLCLRGKMFENYLNDMKIAQEFSNLNRQAILDCIVEKMNLTVVDKISSIHNYIDLDNMILRKGAISAQKGEKLIIPINMKDGCIIGVGKGNPDTNCSAPHGAGRVYSRSEAKEVISMEDYIESMNDVWSRSVEESTIDESPLAYKSKDEIVNNIESMVEIEDNLISIYNVKSTKFYEKK